MWSVLLRGRPSLAGFCGFRFIEDTRDVELLYGLYPQYWGQGLATETARTVGLL